MKRLTRVILVVLVGIAFAGSCFSGQGVGGATALIKEAKISIKQGEKEKAISTLNAAFESANSTGDYESLMEIGDLYIGVDLSLNEKAMRAWTAAGHWKCQ